MLGVGDGGERRDHDLVQARAVGPGGVKRGLGRVDNEGRLCRLVEHLLAGLRGVLHRDDLEGARGLLLQPGADIRGADPPGHGDLDPVRGRGMDRQQVTQQEPEHEQQRKP